MHKRYSGAQNLLSLTKLADFECKKYFGLTGDADGDVTVDDDITENVAKFSYLEDVLSSGREVFQFPLFQFTYLF